jgi:hypothetical protein
MASGDDIFLASRTDEYQSSRCILEPLPRVARKRIAADEAARVGRHEMRLLHMHVGAFGIGHARIDVERRRLGALGQRHRVFGAQVPRIEQLQVARRQFQHVLVGQAGAIVVGGEAGDVVGRFHRRLQRGRRKIGGAGVAAALADEHRHAHTLVLVLLDRLDLALADRHRQTTAFADFDGAIGTALRLGERQHIACELLQLILSVGEMGIAHGLFSSVGR